MFHFPKPYRSCFLASLIIVDDRRSSLFLQPVSHQPPGSRKVPSSLWQVLSAPWAVQGPQSLPSVAIPAPSTADHSQPAVLDQELVVFHRTKSSPIASSNLGKVFNIRNWVLAVYQQTIIIINRECSKVVPSHRLT